MTRSDDPAPVSREATGDSAGTGLVRPPGPGPRPEADAIAEFVQRTRVESEHGYFRAHWLGLHSLPRSYWINVALFSAMIALPLRILDAYLAEMGLDANLAAIFLSCALLAVMATWMYVGLWRSASRRVAETGRRGWAYLAKFIVVSGVGANAFLVVTSLFDASRLMVELDSPLLSEYAIEVVGDTDLYLSGALNEASVDEALKLLESGADEILVVNSGGGLVEPAIRLARYIREHAIMVLADGECSSACVYLLAASPSASVVLGSAVVFHQTQPVVEFTNPQFRYEQRASFAAYDDVLRELDVAEWALEEAGKYEFWEPTLGQLIAMNLVVGVYDPDSERFMTGDAFCEERPAACNGIPEE